MSNQVKKSSFVKGFNDVDLGINGILLPKLFWPLWEKNCSSDREKVLKFGAEGQEFAKLWDH